MALLDGAAVDGHPSETGEEARAATRDLARREGVLGGYSAGANLAALLRLLADRHRGGVVAMIACDGGPKHLSTDLWGRGPVA